jgi:hypothetical protein
MNSRTAGSTSMASSNIAAMKFSRSAASKWEKPVFMTRANNKARAHIASNKNSLGIRTGSSSACAAIVPSR